MLEKTMKLLAILFCVFWASAALAVEEVKPSGDLMLMVAKDKTRIYGSKYQSTHNNSKIVLLFHQADSNRMEYEPLLSRIHIAGFDTLTVDQRSGGKRWEFDNVTVKRLGKSSEHIEAYPDLEAALEYVIKRKYKTIVVVGSSYSASLAIVLASKNPDKVTAVAAFSPGEYFPDKNWIKTSAAILKVPLYITGATNENKRIEEVMVNMNEDDFTYYQAFNSMHGASTLRQDMNPEGYKANMDNFIAFLERFR
jgi:pimeloyl-ACP methyl ester carboxylesterase